MPQRYTGSYQQGGGGGGSGSGYQPPVAYAAEQTRTLEDTTQTYVQADETAAQVLHHLTAQRHQIQGAHDQVWEMRQLTEKAKRELQELQKKYRDKKQKLYVLIAMLALTDMLLFFRILQCRGGFFC